ncbi:MAG: hypothetical protein N4A63_13075 [Vallitalea sp.]|jgi:hypothetical protein|nr:hypothetical protein [Vallitalea sp.]
MSTELKKSWEVYKVIIFKILVVITIQSLLIEFMDVFLTVAVYNRIFYYIIKAIFFIIKILLNSVSLLVITHTIYDYYKLQQVNLIDIVKRTLGDFRQILIIISLELLITVVCSLNALNIILLGIFKVLTVFIWQSYIIGNKRMINVFKDSCLLVIHNIKDLLKYLLLYFGIYIVFIILDFIYPSYESINFIFKYCYQLLYAYITVLFTYLYMKYNKNAQQSDFS